MPANLPPQYFAAEKEYKNAKTIPEKIAALEAMLAIMPHHKGTDKLRAGLTRKMAQLRMQAESRSKSRRGSLFSIEKQGAAQIVLVGSPNTGKSSILAALTNATPEIADYPYTTGIPNIGMMPYEDIQIQIVDLPPISDDVRKLPFYNLLRTADALLIVLDGSGEPELEITLLFEELEAGKIYSFLKEEDDLPFGSVRKRMLIILNKCDGAEARGAMEAVREVTGGVIEAIAVSTTDGTGMDELRKRIYGVIEVVRVYTKIPGKKPDMHAPYVLPCGSTVMDLASAIHRDFADNLRFARVWGSARFDGQSVQRDYILQDGDVIELHI
ncbi:MAG: TGS domain-containing protein [bacterium]|nr:MAG: TGS domain-containing protein [bacterium]